MSAGNKKKLKLLKKQSLDKLSANVVVYNILTFLILPNARYYYVDPSKGKKPMDLAAFGYFKKDLLRNIWMIFVSIQSYHYKTYIYRDSSRTHQRLLIDFTKIRSLEIMETQSKNIPMVQMKNLSLFNPIPFHMFDSRRECAILSIPQNSPQIGYVEYYNKTKGEFLIMKFLRLQTPHSLTRLLIFGNQLNLPSLKKHPLNELYELRKFVNLKCLKLICVDMYGTHWGNNDLKKLKKLIIIHGKGFEELGAEKLKNLKELNLHNIDLYPFQSSNGVIFKSLTSLDIDHCSFYARTKKEFKSFLKLGFKEIANAPIPTRKSWKLSSKLKNLSLSHVHRFPDDFFKLNHFNELRHLCIECLHQLSGRDWHSLSSLKKLHLNTVSIDDEFFKQQSLLNLEELIIVNCHDINGRTSCLGWICGWNPLPKLETLILKFSHIEDIFFQKMNFKSLRTLILENNYSLNWIGWNRNRTFAGLKLIQIKTNKYGEYLKKFHTEYQHFYQLKKFDVETKERGEIERIEQV